MPFETAFRLPILMYTLLIATTGRFVLSNYLYFIEKPISICMPHDLLNVFMKRRLNLHTSSENYADNYDHTGLSNSSAF